LSMWSLATWQHVRTFSSSYKAATFIAITRRNLHLHNLVVFHEGLSIEQCLSNEQLAYTAALTHRNIVRQRLATCALTSSHTFGQGEYVQAISSFSFLRRWKHVRLQVLLVHLSHGISWYRLDDLPYARYLVWSQMILQPGLKRLQRMRCI
jgi:hypothetical protein